MHNENDEARITRRVAKAGHMRANTELGGELVFQIDDTPKALEGVDEA